ncbi:response regulator [Seleniivibrio woodruffii]|uniref:Regulatory Fis family protein n=1 Tax=Seleniivibrio woodruffii TaxID=1078050 RepID=A0A4R1K5F4_9BACT|nr:response regulator [Seleniivibrio woodruffii]TCK59402.1 regulatory Fis family protein [Seleniivibrio woodruffii]TVZ35557.1 two-component system NtrC family response regulator [Seleniivibrio woodruffii]
MLRILVVEDDEAIRSQLCFALERKYEVSEASNAPDAIAATSGKTFDAAVVDLGMPPSEQSPVEGLKVIDHLLATSQCKIIVLTGQGTQETAMKALERGVFDFLLKPVKMEQLLFSIERAELFITTERELQKQGVERIELQVKIGDGLQKLRESAEKNIILKVLNETGFNVYQSAKILGVKRESLYYFIKKFNLVRKTDA